MPRRYHPGGCATPLEAGLDKPRRVDQPPVRGGRNGPHDFHYHYPRPPPEKGLGGPTGDDRGISSDSSRLGVPKTSLFPSRNLIFLKIDFLGTCKNL